MENLIRKFEEYLYKTVEISVEPKQWQGVDKLPFYLREMYEFFLIEILSCKIIVMVQNINEEQTPVTIKKNYEVLKKNWSGEVLYLSNSITAYNRKRLIEQKVPFVVPDNQLYLPELGIDLREHFRQIRSKVDQFSPSTQLLLLYSIIKKNYGPYTPAEMACILHYTPMTLTRAFDELETAEIGIIKNEGRQRVLTLPENGHEIWKNTQLYLKNPVRETVWVGFDNSIYKTNNIPEAGLTALSKYSMIAEPEYKILAISSDSWKILKYDKKVHVLPFRDHNAVQLQIWRYSPELLSSNNKVDFLSLYLSLYNEKDERVQKALSEMMEEFNW